MSRAPEKPKRRIRSFLTEADVERMLNRTERDGYQFTRIANIALRGWLTEKGYGRKKDTAPQPMEAAA